MNVLPPDPDELAGRKSGWYDDAKQPGEEEPKEPTVRLATARFFVGLALALGGLMGAVLTATAGHDVETKTVTVTKNVPVVVTDVVRPKSGPTLAEAFVSYAPCFPSVAALGTTPPTDLRRGMAALRHEPGTRDVMYAEREVDGKTYWLVMVVKCP